MKLPVSEEDKLGRKKEYFYSMLLHRFLVPYCYKAYNTLRGIMKRAVLCFFGKCSDLCGLCDLNKNMKDTTRTIIDIKEH